MDGVIESVGDVGRMNFRRAGGRPQRRAMVPQAPKGQVVNAFPYYSSVRFQADITSAGSPAVFTYRIPAGSERRAFGYAIGDSIAGGVGGFPAGFVATPLETNLIQRAQTNAGENLIIQGISCYVSGESDPLLAAMLLERLSVQIALNGDSQLVRLGRCSFMPGGGGLHGAGHSRILRPGASDQTSIFSIATNGLPGRENFFPLPMPIVWKSAGKADSNLVILAKAERDLVFSSTSRVAATGIEAWSPPSVAGDLGTYVDLVFKLLTKSVSPRSVNA
jgi:hypothetical protein